MKLLIALVVLAACHDDVDVPEPEAEVVNRRFHADTTELWLRITTHADGTRDLHGETAMHLDAVFGDEPTRVEAIETATLDAAGRLVRADLRHRITLATTVIEHGTVIAGDALQLARPSGLVEIPLDAELAWVPVTLAISHHLPTPLPSALACQVMGAAVASPAVGLIDPVRGFAQVFDGGITGPLPVLGYGVECTYDADALVAGIADPTFGPLAVDNSTDETPLVAAFEIPDPTEVIEPQACEPPPNSEPFTVTATDGRLLAGQIDLPAGGGPFPVVTLSSGTGGGDREGRFFGAPQWTCLAAALVDAGIAVVRYDDPGHGASPGPFEELTYEDRDAHAIAIARFAADHAAIDPARVFALGHSEGGDRVARVAIAVPEVTGIILVAGVATTGGDALIDQAGALFANAGYSAAVVEAIRDQESARVAAIRDGSATEDQLDGLPRAFWEQFVAFDGTADVIAAARPTLVLQGGADWQVVPANADRFEAAPIAVDVVRFPDLGHLMTRTAPTAAGIGEEYGVPVAFDDRVVAAIVEWVLAR